MADLLDLLTLPEAKRAINKPAADAEKDEELALHITAVSNHIDTRCGPVVQREAVEEPDPGKPTLRLSLYPVAEITQVREAMPGSSPTVLTVQAFGSYGDGYRTKRWSAADPDLLSGELTRSRYGSGIPWGPAEVTYVAGRAENTAAVPERFKSCAGSILRRLWKREAGTWAQTVSVFEDADGTLGTGFFRVADPLIDEMLWGDVQTHLIGFR